MPKFYAHLTEVYSWFPLKGEKEPYRGAFTTDAYQEIPQDLWERLKKAEQALDAVQDEVDAYEKDGQALPPPSRSESSQGESKS